jgi:hypothetical protein
MKFLKQTPILRKISTFSDTVGIKFLKLFSEFLSENSSKILKNRILFQNFIQNSENVLGKKS